MIRQYDRMDARRLKSNKFSKVSDMGFVLLDKSFYKSTLVGENSEVYAIICFRRYWKNNFLAFFLISEDMPAIYARELKKFVFDAIMDFDADRVQTDSVDCEELNKWHEFLGFTCEGHREQMMLGNDYKMWGLLRGRDF